MTVNSYKGSGVVSAVRDDFELDTYKGSFDVETAQLADVHLSTYKGDLDVTTSGGDDFRIQADSYKGDIAVRGYEVVETQGQRNTNIDYRVGNGTNDININTYKGNVDIEF